MAGGTADVLIDRPTRIEEECLAERNSLRADRVLRIAEVSRNLLEQGARPLQLCGVDVLSRCSARGERNESGNNDDVSHLVSHGHLPSSREKMCATLRRWI